MDLHDGDQTGIQVISLRLFSVQHLYWVSTAWNGENGGLVEILGELHSVQRSGCHNQLHVCALLYSLCKKNPTQSDA